MEDEEIERYAYLYEPVTRTLYPLALRYLYEAAGAWPADGFEVPVSIADEYIQSERRAETEIAQVGAQFEIRDIQ
ncbi:hypothetical protein [Achromobacter mucicolens]|uniref:hypothetical protein n=1 Tax=Achromobacter mucicolens TaxID=1389922 RepID=UPI0022F3B598|nr:hypothetical protein [Achromobacter mucicolens]WBX91554.1 hypothetical protein PE062_13225 [Achromobacter mucicolens]